MNWSLLVKYFLMICGAVAGYLHPTFPFILLVTIFVFLDCWSAWRLSRRVKEKYPNKASGKFRSNSFMKVFLHTLPFIYALIIAAYYADSKLLPETNLHLANIIAGGFSFAQLWSILENEACLNEKPWARILQKVVVSKVERHFDLELEDELEKMREEIRKEIEEEYGIKPTKKSKKTTKKDERLQD